MRRHEGIYFMNHIQASPEPYSELNLLHSVTPVDWMVGLAAIKERALKLSLHLSKYPRA